MLQWLCLANPTCVPLCKNFNNLAISLKYDSAFSNASGLSDELHIVVVVHCLRSSFLDNIPALFFLAKKVAMVGISLGFLLLANLYN